MTPLEAKLRTALHETAAEVPPAAPPRRPPAVSGRTALTPRRTVHMRAFRARAFRTWAVPAAAAIMVAAVTTGSLAISGSVGQHRSGAAAASNPATSTLPPFEVALRGPGGRSQNDYSPVASAAVIRATATGAVIATITPPRPYTIFSGVSGSADDRVFVLTASTMARTPPVRLFVLRLGPSGQVTQFKPLSATGLPTGTYVDYLGLSPDGTKLAVIASSASALAGPAAIPWRITVFSLTSQITRTWTASPNISRKEYTPLLLGPAGTLGWTADGRMLSFAYMGGVIRLLDTTAPGSDLLADSRPVPGPRGGLSDWNDPFITPDGRVVVGTLMPAAAVAEYSIVTGTMTVPPIKPNPAQPDLIRWTNANGSALAVLSVDGPRSVSAFLIVNGHATPIPWSSDLINAAW